ncbi:MAG: hypothetical protein KC636_25290 [Myxococcales bacterium]|nr:hypothetical protein [Myxococcales bacterium]
MPRKGLCASLLAAVLGSACAPSSDAPKGDAVKPGPATAADERFAALERCVDVAFAWQDAPADQRAARLEESLEAAQTVCADHLYARCVRRPDRALKLQGAEGVAGIKAQIDHCAATFCDQLPTPRPTLCERGSARLDDPVDDEAAVAAIMRDVVDFHVAMILASYELDRAVYGDRVEALVRRIAVVWMLPATLRTIHVAPPKPRAPAADLGFRVTITKAGFRLETAAARPWVHDPSAGPRRDTTLARAPHDDLYEGWPYGQLEAEARALKHAHPGDPQVILQADSEIPMQVLIEVMDALRGHRCDVETSTDSAACYFWRPIVQEAPATAE